MQKQSKSSKPENSSIKYIKPMIISQIVGIGTIFILFILFAFLMTIQTIPISALHTIITTAGAAGGLTAGFVCGKLISKNGMIFGAICGLIMCVLITLVAIIAFNFNFWPFSFIKFIAIIASSTIGGIIGVNKNR